MKKLLLFVFLLGTLSAGTAWGQIAFDGVTETTGTDTLSMACPDVDSSPQGAVIFVMENNSGNSPADVISDCSFGSAAMTRVALSSDAVGSVTGQVYGYFLGSSIPTGAQTCSCTVSAGTTSKLMVAITVTAGADTQLAGMGDGTGYCGSVVAEANPDCVIGSIAGASYAFGGLWSGVNGPGGITAGSGFTILGSGADFGVEAARAESNTSEVASGDQTVAFTATDNSQALLGIAIEEVGGAVPRREVRVLQ